MCSCPSCSRVFERILAGKAGAARQRVIISTRPGWFGLWSLANL
jgi:hypothetical protein